MLREAMCLAVLEIWPARGRELRLGRHCVVGRAASCDVRLDDPLVSRRHAKLTSGGLEDLGSANGVYVNARRCRGPTPLHAGDVIQLGATVWLVIAQPRSESEVAPTA
jgi:pSer/pThr/pTyr-binding forkhead associated (FHA) protein